MEQIDQLLTIAEISVALAGFAGIIFAFQRGRSRAVSRGQVLLLSMVVNISLMAAFFSVLPVGLFNIGMAESNVWATTSLLLGLNQTAFLAFIVRNRRMGSLPIRVRVANVTLLFLGAIIGIADILNAFHFVFADGFAMIFITIVFCLGVVCVQFSRLLLLPIWREAGRAA